MRTALVLSLALATLLGGCGRRPAQEAGGSAPAATGAAPATGAPAQKSKAAHQIPTVLAGKLNVAFVYVGPVGDGGWTYAHNQARLKLEKAVPEVHTVALESVAEGADAESVIRALARKGFELIVTTSFGFMDPTETVAGEFPKVKFVHVSGFKKNATNFGNAFGAMESMKYLAGMIAGARAKADGSPKLGYIAPFPIPEVIRLGNALMLGAKQTCPECTMEIRWVNSWFDPGKEQEAAESMLNAGVDVVVTGADTTGPIVVAGKRGRWAIGYDSDNACEADKAHCLTTPYWNWEVYYVDLVRQIRAGSWKPSAWYGDVDSGVLGLYGFEEGRTPGPGVPAAVVPLVRQKLADMKAGKFTRFDVFAAPLKDNKGNVVLPAGKKMTQEDLEGREGCAVCMSWLAEGIVGEIPRK
ncbi:MAG: BMP family ABC transporter substrate-binding protein [Deltaproteobacteria bacterium]|nr:BMP family ABC transporter substrate-binding protein [Deltaproteobacteria bacterium]